MDSLRKEIGLRRLTVKKAASDGLIYASHAPIERTACRRKPLLPAASNSRQIDQFPVQRNSCKSAAHKATLDKVIKTTSAGPSAAVEASTCSLPDYALLAESDDDNGVDSDMDQGEDPDEIEADYGHRDVNVWLHPIHGLPQDSSVRACPVKIARRESVCHFGSAFLKKPFATLGIRCTFKDGSLKAVDCGKRVAVPLLHATVVDATDLPFNCSFTVVRVIEDAQGNESHELKGWLMICNTEDRLNLLDTLGSFGCTRQDFTDQYQLQMDLMLGAGGSGEVYAAKVVKNSQLVAAKLVKGKSKDEKLAREIKFLAASGRHKNIVHFLGVFDNVSSTLEDQMCCLLFACYQQGDLYTNLVTNGPYRGDHAVQVIVDILTALVHIHSLGIVHRDVKPENCLLRDDGRIVLSDFGSAVHLSEQALLLKRVGSLGYAAPEIFMDMMQDTKVDMFSAGATFFMLMTRQHPFPGHIPASIVQRTLACAVNWKALDAEDINTQVYDLLENLLMVNQQLRLSADGALQHIKLSRMIC